MDSFEKLKQAKDLFDQGIISEEEYNTLRDRLMKELPNANAAAAQARPSAAPQQQQAAYTRPMQNTMYTQPVQPAQPQAQPQAFGAQAQPQAAQPIPAAAQPQAQQAAYARPMQNTMYTQPVQPTQSQAAQPQAAQPQAFGAQPQAQPQPAQPQAFGAQSQVPGAQPQQAPHAAHPAVVSNAPASTGMKVLSFLIPLVGLILFLMNKDIKPVEAKEEIMWAGIGFGVGILGYVILMAIGIGAYY